MSTKQQFTVMLVTPTTPGSGAGESVTQEYPGLVNLTGYTIEVEAIAKGSIGGTSRYQSFTQNYTVSKAGGVSTLEATGPLEQFGDVEADSWNLDMAIGTAPDSIEFTFSTGSTTATAACSIAVRITSLVVS